MFIHGVSLSLSENPSRSLALDPLGKTKFSLFRGGLPSTIHPPSKCFARSPYILLGWQPELELQLQNGK
nr:hypothetical protein Q903MT_gene5985 [Picea sitchensis]